MRSVAFGPISVHSRQVSLYWQCSITISGNINISSWYLVHLGAGFWAAIAGPIFRKDTGIIYVSGTRESFSTFGWQLLGALAIFVWAGLTLFIIMLPFLCARCATYKDAGELFNSIFNLFLRWQQTKPTGCSTSAFDHCEVEHFVVIILKLYSSGAPENHTDNF